MANKYTVNGNILSMLWSGKYSQFLKGMGRPIKWLKPERYMGFSPLFVKEQMLNKLEHNLIAA